DRPHESAAAAEPNSKLRLSNALTSSSLRPADLVSALCPCGQCRPRPWLCPEQARQNARRGAQIGGELALARRLWLRIRCRPPTLWEEPLMLKGIGPVLLALMAAAAITSDAASQSGDPIKIGFGMALTGPLAANGKQALLGMKIWEEETNAKGGLLGRPVKLVNYDD